MPLRGYKVSLRGVDGYRRFKCSAAEMGGAVGLCLAATRPAEARRLAGLPAAAPGEHGRSVAVRRLVNTVGQWPGGAW